MTNGDGDELSNDARAFCVLAEDTLMVKIGSKRMAERRATLFDGVLVFSKRKRSSSASGQSGANCLSVEYKQKELYFVRLVEIKDREDTEGEIYARVGGNWKLSAM